MRDYAALESLKAAQKTIINDAFDKGYEQGYADGKKEVAAELNFEKGYEKGYEDGTKAKDGERGSIYYGGYADGYEKGLKDGIDRAWEAARTLISEVIKGSQSNECETKEDYVRNATPEEKSSVDDYIKSISEETGVTFNGKEEQTTTLCRKCIHAHNMHDNILTCDAVPCVIDENGHCDKYEEKQDAPEMNVDTIENRDKIVKAIAGLLAAYGEQLWDVVADMQKNP
jgi:hypothetical protein